MKKLLALALATSMALSLVACSKPAETTTPEAPKPDAGTSTPATTPAADPISLTICGTNGVGDTQSMAHEEFAKRLNELGGWDAKAMVSSEMGSTDDVLEQAQQGAAVVAASDPSRIAAYVPEIGILMMPYLFEEYSDLDNLMETELYKGWKEDLKADGLYLLTNNCLTGWRNWVTNNVVEKPEDLNGIKIRTMGSPIAINSVNAMGGIATPMDQNEAYNAIANKTIDGGEWQIPTIYTLKLYEVCKNVSLSHHFLLTGSIVAGTKFYDSLSTDMQAQLDDTAVNTYKDNQAIVMDLESDYIAKMEAEGVTFTTPDYDAFADASVHLYADDATTGGVDYEALRTELLAQLAG